MKNLFLKALISITVLIITHSTQAHHSLAGVYNIREEGQLTGVLTKVAFTNPHGAFHITVKNEDGTETEWILTTGSANTLSNLGFGEGGSNNVTAGDTVSAVFFPARNGRPLGFVRNINLPGDRRVEFTPE